jgi:lipoyl(octanoyl) transferase
LGAAFHAENLLFPPEYYADKGIDLVPTDRGGDVTYHGPGQLVIYPIFDLRRHGSDLHKWMRDLEETIIVALQHWGLEARRFPGYTGVWVGDEKAAAIGVKVRRWISIHGIALNCSNDPNDGFSLIVPCGIRDYAVTSLSRLTGKTVSPDEAKAPVIEAFKTVFATT